MMEDEPQSADEGSPDLMSEARRCRNVYRFLPKQFVVEGLSSIWTDGKDTSLPPSGFTPKPSADAALTAFAQLVAFRLDVACCMISLIDHQYQYILAESKRELPIRIAQNDSYPDGLWLGSLTIPRNRTIDGKVIDMNLSASKNPSNCKTVVIEDLPAFLSENAPALAKDYSRWSFYAGTPLYSSNRAIVGVLSVLDTHSRDQALSAEDQTTLQDMAITTMDLLMARKAHEERSRGERMIRGLADFIGGASSLKEPSISPASSPILDPSQSIKSVSPPVIPSPSLLAHEDQDRESGLSESLSSVDRGEPQSNDSTANLDAATLDAATLDAATLDAATLASNLSKPDVVDLHGKEGSEAQEAPTLGNDRPHELTTAEMQKSILPQNAETMFSRAANVMRQTSELDGVIFLDASVAAIGREDDRKAASEHYTDRSEDEAHSTQVRSRRHNPSVSSKESISSSDSSLNDKTGLASETRQCQILGSSQIDAVSTDKRRTWSNQASLSEKLLRRILRLYPHGKIFNYGTNGDLVTSSSDEHTIHPRLTTKVSKSKKNLEHRQKSKSVPDSLKAIIPDAQSICVLPLWDYDRSRWFTCCIVWTSTPMRILSPSVDLMFFKAFSNSVMNELSRLDSSSSDRMKTTFVASISHELRSPLHGILGSIEFLQSTKLDAFQQAMLLSAHTCSYTLLDVINHVLDLTQVQQFHGVEKSSIQLRDNHTIYIPHRRKINTNFDTKRLLPISNLRVVTEEVVESVFASFSYRIKQSKMEDNDLKSPGGPQGPDTIPNESPMMANRKLVLVILDIPAQAEVSLDLPVGALRRILMNLIGNSIKYTESGYIKIDVKISNTGQKLDPKHSRVTINVDDTGIGMTPDFLVHRVFTPFSQENSFSAGIGLGLHLVRRLVDSLGGSIRVRSILGQGTEVKVALDALKSAVNAPVAGQKSRLNSIRSRMSGKTICILQSTALDSRFTVEKQSVGARLFGEAISRTLELWLEVKTIFTDKWVGQDVDIVIMVEPSFKNLKLIRNMTPANRSPPLTLMIAIDAVEADTLRHDARVQSKESVVEVIAQPCGPEKLARILDHCLDRHDANESVNTNDIAYEEEPTTRSLSLTESMSEPSPLQVHSTLVPLKESSDIESNSIVLITDDNPINRRLLVALMRRYTVKYLEASNGLEALELYKSRHQEITAILMDISMPVMDGMTSTREIRRFERSSKLSPTSIIALTGLVSASARLEAAESGVDEFLTKPVNFAKLTALLPGVFLEVQTSER